MEVKTRNFAVKAVHPNNAEAADFKLEDHRTPHRERSVYFDEIDIGAVMGYSWDAVRFLRAPEKFDNVRSRASVFMVEIEELDSAILEQLQHIEEHGSMKGADEVVEP